MNIKQTSLKTDISLTLMRKAPKRPFKFLKNSNFLNILLGIPYYPLISLEVPWRFIGGPLEVPRRSLGGPSEVVGRSLGGPSEVSQKSLRGPLEVSWRFPEVLWGISNDENYITNECVTSTSFWCLWDWYVMLRLHIHL